jgi:hypothetical protein
MRPNRTTLLLALFHALTSVALASSTWYVNGVSGSDNNSCLSTARPCKTIGHAISLAAAGDTIRVIPATYKENLTVGINLTLIGAGAATTIIDGGGVNIVVTVSNANAHVSISNVTVRNGSGRPGGGIYNNGILTVNKCTVSGNIARGTPSGGLGGGIHNGGTLKVNNSTVTGNQVSGVFGAGFGGGIGNSGTVIVTNSTISGNTSSGWGGGIGNLGGNVSINNTTVAGNKETYSYGGIANYSGTITLQNSVTANNSGGDCYTRVAITSNGYNLSSDGTCAFSGPGDRNNVDPMLGPLQNNGGPTQTMALPLGSPAVDAGNPTGCTNGLGHLLKTDQRGKPRPDTEDTGACDMGAYERQSD